MTDASAPKKHSRPLACVILAAGMGTRMKSRLPKVLHKVAGRTMLNHVIAASEALSPERIIVVTGPDQEAVAMAAQPHGSVVQAERLGTANAVAAARNALDGVDGDVLVLYGDTPLVTAETLARLVEARQADDDPAVVVLGMEPHDPGPYGRLVMAPDGGLERIVEAADATSDELAVRLCNGGLMAFDGRRLWDIIDRIGNDNAKGEYYLTDAVSVARALGHACAVVTGSESEVAGVNSRRDLAHVEALMQERLRARAMEAGVTLIDPASVYLAADTVLAPDVVIEPNVMFGPGVSVAEGAEILGFSHIEGAEIGAGARVGPFARLRPGTRLGQQVHVGNFVETKNATLDAGAKANHLSYLGDATVGAKANVGAGTITCNYDGFTKARTEIGAGAFIGSNSALVAPVSIGEGAIVGAGSVITRPVPDNALGLTRASQRTMDGWAEWFRAHRGAAKSGR